MFVLLNGDIVSADKAQISVNDRGFLFGDGLFTTLKVHDGNVFLYTEHIEKLFSQCKELNIIPPYIDPKQINELITKNNAETHTWRLKIIITGGTSTSLHFNQRKHQTCLITLKRYRSSITQALNIGISSRSFVDPYAQYKTLSFISRLGLKQAAEDTGFDDLISTTEKDVILESAFSNIFWKLDDKVYTPSSTLPLYFGTTLSFHLKTVTNLGYHVHEVQHTLNAIPSDACVYLCNSLNELAQVNRIENRRFSYDLNFEHHLCTGMYTFVSNNSGCESLNSGFKYSVKQS